MDVKPIKTKRDYEATLKEIERLMGARRDSSASPIVSTKSSATSDRLRWRWRGSCIGGLESPRSHWFDRRR